MEALWTLEDAQSFLRVSRSVLYRMMGRSDDPLPFLRFGSLRRFDPSSVRAWALRQEDGGVSRKPLAIAEGIDTAFADQFIFGAGKRVAK